MIKSKQSFFAILAKMEELQSNLLSIILYKHPDLDISSRESFFEKIAPFYNRYTLSDRASISVMETFDDNEIDNWKNRDLRIEEIKLQSVRGFPESQIPFGISFLGDDGEPKSMVILGANSVGKSSIFGAMEYSFCQKIGEAQLRSTGHFNSGDDYFKTYLQHFNIPFDKSTCKSLLKSKIEFDLSKENIPLVIRRKINPDSHFISDYDIYSNGQIDFLGNDTNSFQNLVANSIGLSDFLLKEKELFSFASYPRRVESTRAGNLSREINNSEKTVEKSLKLIEEKIKLLAQIQTAPNITDQNKRVESNIQTISKLRNNLYSQSIDIGSLVSVSDTFSTNYIDFLAISEKTKRLDQLQFYQEGLKILLEERTCPICNNSRLNPDEIKTALENKIKQLQEYSKLTSDLNKSSNIFIDKILDLNSSTVILRNKVVSDISLVQGNIEFHELMKECDSFLSQINELQSHDLFSKISGLRNNQYSVSSKLLDLKEITDKYYDFFRKDLAEFVTILDDFIKRRDIILEKIEKSLLNQSNIGSKEAEKAILSNEIKQLNEQIVIERNSIKSKTKDLATLTEQIDLFKKIKEETRQYVNVYHRMLAKEIKDSFDPIKTMVKSVIDKYFYFENRPVTLKIELKPENYDEETGEVISEIITASIVKNSDSSDIIPVNKYFNTFHYRLFCSLVGISIAMASRKSTGINIPLVMDDIFYASDFENRINIEAFIINLFDIFKEYSPDTELQLILFTHDQVIFESIIKAAKIKNFENILFVKLFGHEESKLENSYYNLVTRIPAFLHYSINQLITK